MSHADVYSAVSAIVPCAHVAWDAGSVPELPWAVYLIDEPDIMAADDGNWVPVSRWRVELYEKARDAQLEAELAEAIRGRFGPVAVSEYWIDTEKCREVVFQFTQIGA